MSKASEWVANVAEWSDKMQFRNDEWAYRSGAPKLEVEGGVVAAVDDDGALYVARQYLKPETANTLARWILDTFGENA